ncbi:MAG: HAD family phosphatase [Parachlamydiaceae bacterium]|nr:HAD family phosphatase [Parachlamydiaceae bacterium]
MHYKNWLGSNEGHTFFAAKRQRKCDLHLNQADFYTKTRVVIFDCDGVLVDTEYLKFLAWQEALASYNVDFSIEEYMPLVGYSSNDIFAMIEKAKRLKLPEQIIYLKNDKYKALQKQGVQAIQPMVDFARTLYENKERLALKLALASSAPNEEILINLRHIGLDNAFDLVISGSDDLEDYIDPEGKNKPKPYIYIEVAKRLNIPPELCLVFEDTAAGVNAAADARMSVIAVPNQFTTQQDFSKASAVLHSYKGLPSIEIFQQ